MNEKEEGWGWARVLSSGPTSKWNQGREEIEERKRKKRKGSVERQMENTESHSSPSQAEVCVSCAVRSSVT